MKRTTVKLPEDLDAKLRSEAARRGVTVSELTREAIETFLNGGPRRVFASAGAGRSGGGENVAERAEEIFAEIMEEKYREREF